MTQTSDHYANERRRYHIMSSLIGWADTQNEPCVWLNLGQIVYIADIHFGNICLDCRLRCRSVMHYPGRKWSKWYWKVFGEYLALSPSLCMEIFSFCVFVFRKTSFRTLRPRQNGRHFADDIFNKSIFFNSYMQTWKDTSIQCHGRYLIRFRQKWSNERS